MTRECDSKVFFHVEIRTDDPELIRALQGVKNKAGFVRMALKHFLSTKQGRETLAIMSRQGPGKKKASVKKAALIGDVLDLDKLLSGEKDRKHKETGAGEKHEHGGFNPDRLL